MSWRFWSVPGLVLSGFLCCLSPCQAKGQGIITGLNITPAHGQSSWWATGKCQPDIECWLSIRTRQGQAWIRLVKGIKSFSSSWQGRTLTLTKQTTTMKKKICEGRITLTWCADSGVCDREWRRADLRFMDFRCCAGSLSQLLCRICHALSHFKIQIAFDAALILIVTLSPLTFLQAIGSPHICNVAWEWFEGTADLYLFIFNPSPPKYTPPFSGRGCEIVFCAERVNLGGNQMQVFLQR